MLHVNRKVRVRLKTTKVLRLGLLTVGIGDGKDQRRRERWVKVYTRGLGSDRS